MTITEIQNREAKVHSLIDDLFGTTTDTEYEKSSIERLQEIIEHLGSGNRVSFILSDRQEVTCILRIETQHMACIASGNIAVINEDVNTAKLEALHLAFEKASLHI